MPSIVMSTSWGKVEEPRGFDTSCRFKCLVEEDSSSEDSQDSDEEEEDDIVPAQAPNRKQHVKYKKILTKEPLLPE
jgi:hypothetical protein